MSTDAVTPLRHRMIEDINPARSAVQQFLESQSSRFEGLITGDAGRAAIKLLAGVVQREALVLTYNDALMAIGFVFIFALLLMPLVKSPRASPLTADSH